MFKDSVINNKKKTEFEKKHRKKILQLRNRFLGEWASSILGLKESHFKNYINIVTNKSFIKDDYSIMVKQIESDFKDNNIKISFSEIELKLKEFQIKANVIMENKLKLDSF